MRTRYVYEVAGHNYRLTDLQAALAIPQLAVIDDSGTFHGAVSWESIGKAQIASERRTSGPSGMTKRFTGLP